MCTRSEWAPKSIFGLNEKINVSYLKQAKTEEKTAQPTKNDECGRQTFQPPKKTQTHISVFKLDDDLSCFRFNFRIQLQNIHTIPQSHSQLTEDNTRHKKKPVDISRFSSVCENDRRQAEAMCKVRTFAFTELLTRYVRLERFSMFDPIRVSLRHTIFGNDQLTPSSSSS